MNYDVAIIGGGASGMLTSVLLKREAPDLKVAIFERNERVGKKLLATGNGRCNYTNQRVESYNFHSENKDFPMEVYSALDNIATIKLLKSIGIYPTFESDGRVFPLSLQGSSVLDILRFQMERLGVELVLSEKIDKVYKTKNFILEGTKKYRADNVVISTGGLAMPVSGSDGIGYRIAKEFSHNIISQTPTIVQLESDYKRRKELKGIRVNSTAYLYIDGNLVDEKSADILFMDYGLSGPAIMDLSREAIKNLDNNKKVEIKVNLIGLPYEEIYSIISERTRTFPGMDLRDFLIGIIDKKAINSVIDEISKDFSSDFIRSIEYNESFIEKLCNILYNFNINIVGYKGYKNAQATTGGIDTREIDSKTMESKLCKNLYFTGEVVDVDGDCGGYNLQWAWSSAYVCANAIINKRS